MYIGKKKKTTSEHKTDHPAKKVSPYNFTELAFHIHGI